MTAIQQQLKRSRSPLKAVVRLCVYLAASGAFAFGIAEWAARTFIPEWAPGTGQLSKFWQYDSSLGWAHVPGMEGVFASHGFETDVTINAAGFRDDDVPIERPIAQARLLVLGDSLVWGFGVDDDDTVTAKLEAKLPNVEAVNLAVSGYSTDQELLLYRDLGHQYDADLVVLVVAYNDLRGNLSRKEYLIYGKPAFEWHGEELEVVNQPVEKTPAIQHLLSQAAMRSYILTAAARILHDLSRPDLPHAGQNPQIATGEEEVKPGNEFEKSKQLRMLIALIVELRKSIYEKQGEVPLLVIFSDGYDQHGRIAAEQLHQHSIDTILLDEHLRAEDPSTHVPDRLHWNPEGNDIVADVIADYVRKHLPDSAAVQQH